MIYLDNAQLQDKESEVSKQKYCSSLHVTLRCPLLQEEPGFTFSIFVSQLGRGNGIQLLLYCSMWHREGASKNEMVPPPISAEKGELRGF